MLRVTKANLKSVLHQGGAYAFPLNVAGGGYEKRRSHSSEPVITKNNRDIKYRSTTLNGSRMLENLEIFKFYKGMYFQLNKTMGGRWRHSAVLKHVCSSAWDPEHILTRSAFAVKGFLFSDFWDFHHYGSKMWM